MSTTTGFYKDNTGYVIDKDPEAELSYLLDWNEYLASGVTISDSTWSVETITGDTDPLTISDDAFTAGTTTVTVAGGTEGNIYRLYNTIETDGAETDRRFFRVKVKARSIE
jgi:uncharacterized protein YabE (DUF348 family)